MLINSWSKISWITTERNFHKFEEFIHTRHHALRCSTSSLFGWNTIETDNLICKICCHDKIVLDDKGTSFTADNPSLHNLSGKNSLFRIKISRWFIDKENITWLS